MDFSPDLDLAEVKSRCYLGIARVPLTSLNFQHALVQNKHRAISPSNVWRLEKIFERNGCWRLQEENVINAVVQDDDLAMALSQSTIAGHELRSLQWAQDAPSLALSDVQCLSGLHRIEAANRYLDENDKWWIVRLFSYGTPKPTLTRIIEAFAYEQRPSDGEIFRKIRLYHRQQDEESEKRWWSCLDKSKPKDLRQLLKRNMLVTAFDTLIDMPGLWSTVQIGALHRLLALKCDEEMILYLKHIAESWDAILQHESQTLPFTIVDSITVHNIELLAPKYSPIDKELVEDLMSRGVLFPSQSDARVRQSLLNNICTFSGLIPSLRTFFEMLKYIEPTCEALRKLLDTRLKSTIRSSLRGLFFEPEQLYVQVSERKQVEVLSTLSSRDQFLVAYADLWAHCSRHFDELTASTPLKDPNESKPVSKGPNPVSWNQLARFALSRGFRIPNAQNLVDEGEKCYFELALDYLHKVDPTCNSFTAHQIQKVVMNSLPAHWDDSNGTELADTKYLPPERRSGRPFESDLMREKQILFIPRLYDASPCQEATLTFVRQDLFSRLFLHPPLQQAKFGKPITSRPTLPEHMDLDDDDNDDNTSNDENTVKSQLLTELQTLKDAHCEMESRHDSLTKKVWDVCNKEKQTLEQELADSVARYTTLEKQHRDLKELTHQLFEESKALKKERIELDQRLAKRQSETVTQSAVQREPMAIEAATMPIVEEHRSTNEVSSVHNQDLKRWEIATQDQSYYELFVGVSNDTDGCLIGRGCLIPKDPNQGILSIAKVLDGAKIHFHGTQLTAITVLGKRIPNLEPSYIFAVFSQHNSTIFLAPESITSKLVASMRVAVIQQSDSASSSVITVADTTIITGKKRRLSDEHEVITKEVATDENVQVFTTGENTVANKRRLLQLKQLLAPPAPLLLTYSTRQEPTDAPTLNATPLLLTYGSPEPSGRTNKRKAL